MTDFIEWFDPERNDHVDAYIVYIETGKWPLEFIPPEVIMGIDWSIALWAKLAAMYVFKQRNNRNEI